MVEALNMRKPIVVAIANYIFPGLGYVLLGKRTTFGWLVMLCVAVQALQLYIDPYPYIVAYATSEFSLALAILAIFILEIAFAYDAYVLAREQK